MTASEETALHSPAQNELSATESFFLSTMADFLNRRKTAYPGNSETTGIDWQQLTVLACNHQVSAIVYQQCRAFPTQHPECQPIAELAEYHAFNLFCYVNRKSLLAQIDAEFSRRGIPYILVKGTEIAQHYPVPEYRSMSDSDILVHEADKQRAHEALVSLGMTYDWQGPFEWVYTKDGLEFELHHQLLYDISINYEHHKAFCNSAWNHSALQSADSTKFLVDWEFHITYLLLHLRKHLLYSGVGFRQYMDLAVIAQTSQVNWATVAANLENLGLLRFGHVCMALCEQWFGVKSPWGSPVPALEESFSQSATSKIMRNGVFGFNDEENLDNKTMNELHARTGRAAKVRYTLRTLFPTYKDMQKAKNYPFLDGRPWLLPAAWIYRFGHIVIHTGAIDSAKEITKTFTLDDAMAKRETMLEQWGL